MAKVHIANEWVDGGTFLNFKEGAIVNIPPEGGRLPGSSEVRYINVPAVALLLLGPILGLLFVIFLPLAVPLVLLSAAIRGLGIKGRAVREAATPMTTPTHVGAAAPHSGRAEREKKAEEPETDPGDLITRLEREIAERRHNRR